VVALIAVCDLVTPLQHFEELRAQGWSVSQARAGHVEFARGIHCVVREAACTDNSAAIPLRGPLGWGSWAKGPDPGEHWKFITAEHLTREVLNVVLPDDAESTGEEHPWSEFVTTLAAAGIRSTKSELASLPYTVVFAPRLHELLDGTNADVTSTFTQLLDNSEPG
jgi:hypothetical protein